MLVQGKGERMTYHHIHIIVIVVHVHVVVIHVHFLGGARVLVWACVLGTSTCMLAAASIQCRIVE